MSSAMKWGAVAIGVGLLALGLWFALGSAPELGVLAPEPAAALEPALDEDPPMTEVRADERESTTSEVASERSPAAATPDGPTRTRLALLVVARGTLAPLAEIEVSVTRILEDPSGPRALVHSITDAEGRAELEVEPGVRLHVLARDRRKKPEEPSGPVELEVEPLAAGERREATLELPVGRDLAFFARVVDGTNDAPIPGARAVDLATGYAADSDADGLLELHMPSWRPGAFELRAAGFGVRRFQPSPGSEGEAQARTLELLPAATLRVTVRDDGTQPLESYNVKLSAKNHELDMPEEQFHLSTGVAFGSGDQRWKAQCAPDGTCEITGLPARVLLEVELLRGDESVLRPGSIALDPGEVRAVEWRLNAGGRVVGLVLDQEDAPVAGCKLGRFPVSAGPSAEIDRWLLMEHVYEQAVGSTSSDAEGRFTFEGVTPGTWWIGPCPDERNESEVAAVAVRVEVPSVGAEHFVELRVERGLYVHGRVQAPDGSVPEKSWLTATGESAGGATSAPMKDDGSFRLGPLPSGSYRLQAMAFRDHASSREVVARAGDEGVVLQLEPAGRIRGAVLDPRSGEGLHAQLSISSDRDPWVRRSTSTQPDGSFELAGLAAGTYVLAATTAGGLVGVLQGVTVVPDAAKDGLRLEVRPGGRVELRYEGEADYGSYEVRSQGAVIVSNALKRGATTIHHVPPGPVEVEYKLGGASIETQRVELAVGEMHSFVLPRRD